MQQLNELRTLSKCNMKSVKKSKKRKKKQAHGNVLTKRHACAGVFVESKIHLRPQTECDFCIVYIALGVQYIDQWPNSAFICNNSFNKPLSACKLTNNQTYTNTGTQPIGEQSQNRESDVSLRNQFKRFSKTIHWWIKNLQTVRSKVQRMQIKSSKVWKFDMIFSREFHLCHTYRHAWIFVLFQTFILSK